MSRISVVDPTEPTAQTMPSHVWGALGTGGASQHFRGQLPPGGPLQCPCKPQPRDGLLVPRTLTPVRPRPRRQPPVGTLIHRRTTRTLTTQAPCRGGGPLVPSGTLAPATAPLDHSSYWLSFPTSWLRDGKRPLLPQALLPWPGREREWEKGCPFQGKKGSPDAPAGSCLGLVCWKCPAATPHFKRV